MLSTTDTSILDLFKSSPSIESLSKATMEWNYNSFYQKSKSGCYLSTYSSTYDSTNSDSAYDDGASYQFFDVGEVSTTMSASANSSTITVASETGISIGMRVRGQSIPTDTYVTNIVSKTITISANTAAAISLGTPVLFLTYKTAIDKERSELTPLSSIFLPNRPDPGIINLVSYRKGSSVIPLENIKMGNFGNVYNGSIADRVYPISKSSSSRYWNSVRKIKNSNIMTTVGLSNSSNLITHAAPFIVYEDSFYMNKIVVKTQKYDGNYPVSFVVEYLPHGSNTWTAAATYTNSSVLSDGTLELYYDKTSAWTTTKTLSNSFIANSDFVRIRGLRLSVTKMSKSRVPLEVIELSPRLILDVTDYTMSFSYSKTISNTSYGIPVSGTVSGSGNIALSNVDKYFSSKGTDSILNDKLVQGVEVKLYHVVNNEDIPLGTFYASNWTESSDLTVSVDLEDYFYFLKRIKSPEIAIANLSGIETSVAILILLDNAGITNYEFVKQSATSDDDYIIDYFYTSKDQTVADVLEQIAISSQCSIYIDANNKIKVVTKEKLTDLVSASNTDFWLVGTDSYSSLEQEYPYLNGEYISNIQSLSESKVIPVTEMTIDYAGIGITRQPKEVLRFPELFKDKNIPYYNSSIVNRNLSFTNTELWSIDSADVGSDKVLLSMPYISEVSSGPAPSIITTAESGNGNLTAISQNALIKTIYENSTESDKRYFEIVVDQERGTEIIQSQKFNGYFVLDAELIKYNGVVIDVFDDKQPQNSGRFVVFDNVELQYLRNKASNGVTISCYSILVEIVYKAKTITSILLSNEIEYEFLSDGRAQENTSIARHTKQTETEMTNNPFAVKLYSSTISSAIKPSGTMSAKGVNLLDPRNPKSENTVSYPGYFKISGPKIVNATQAGITFKDDFTEDKGRLAIDNLGEQFVTGFYKELDFTPVKISTRMRLLEKPKKDIFTGTDSKIPPYSPENRGIAGIAFNLTYTAGAGTTGYFIEIEDIANITGEQLEAAKFKNLRFYKVYIDSTTGIYTPKVLKSAWVNVSATASESIDFGSIVLNEGRSYAGTSDLSVVIEEKEDESRFYKVYWETNLVLTYLESKADRDSTPGIKRESKNIGFMSRSDSEAMFDYLAAMSISKNAKYRIPVMLAGNSEYITETDAAERGSLPVSISSSIVGENSIQYAYEDFGNQMREAKKFSVQFEKPAILARLLSLTKTNKDYYVTDFSYSSKSADFWVFNTSRASLGLSMDMNTPLIISGVALEEINPGSITLSSYLKNKSSYSLDYTNINKNKYGENSVSLSGNYINNLDQAQKHLEWVYNHANAVKSEFDISIFANPLLEIGDKIRIYDTNTNNTVDISGVDKVYYISSINYNIGENGPEMSIKVREI